MWGRGGGKDYNPPAVTYFYPDVLLPKSLLFHGLEWEDEWGKNLLSGQGLKGFMGFISELEQKAGMKAKMLVPGHSCLGLSTMATVFYSCRSIDKVSWVQLPSHQHTFLPVPGLCLSLEPKSAPEYRVQ